MVHKKTLKKKGGFVPSIGEPFSMVVSKFIAPIAMYLGYKFVTSKSKTRKQKHNNKRKRYKGGACDFCDLPPLKI